MKRIVGLLCAVSFLAVILVPNAAANASEAVYVTARAADAAPHIVNGRVISTIDLELDGQPHRVSEIEVTSTIKGSATGTILLEVPGGQRADGTYMFVSHTPDFVPGEQVQVAVMETPGLKGLNITAAVQPGRPTYSVVGGTDGAYGILPDGVGRAEAVGDYSLHGASWQDFAPPLIFQVNPANSGLSSTATIAAVKRGFQIWEDDPHSTVDFTYGGTTTKSGVSLSDNRTVVSWVSPPAGSGWLAQASWSATNRGDIIGFDVRVSRNFAWANGAVSRRFDIGTTIAHEVGHGIGFGHTPSSSEVMFATISSGRVKPLGSGDRSGLAALYSPTGPAAFVSPSSGAPLCSGDVVSWSGGSGNFWVTVGVPGQVNKFMSAGAGADRFKVVSGIPSNSESLVTLYQSGQSGYSIVAQRVQSACNPVPAAFVSPSSGAGLCSGDVVSWSGGSGNFWVAVGDSGQRNRFMSAGTGANRSIVVSGVPSNSESLVTLYQRQANQSGYSIVAQQVQSACNPVPAAFVSPSSGAGLCSGDVVSWSGGSGNFWVAVGDSGQRNRFMSAGTGANRSIVVSGVPSNSETLVTLWQRQANQSGYSIVAEQVQSACNPVPAAFVSPSSGAALCSGDVVSWSGGSGNFWVAVGDSGQRNRFMSAGTGANRSIVVSGVPSSSETLVTLWQRQAGDPSYLMVAEQTQSACN